MRIDDKLHIAFICDENYVMPTAVAITSLYMNKRSATQYHVHVLASDVSEGSLGLLSNLARDGFDVDVLDLTQSPALAACKIEGLHVSTAALYKFSIAHLFPNLDKILYLDSDILVQKDLSDLFDVDISNVYAAVVKDLKPMTYKPSQVKKLKVRHSAYFNSGVMLLNLDKFREDDMMHKLLEYRLNGINYFMDQDALNVVFHERVKYISYLYNVMSSVMVSFETKDILNYYQLAGLETKNDIYDHAAIVHLCTKYKPWEYSNVPFADEWLFYWQNAGFAYELYRKTLDEYAESVDDEMNDDKLSPAEWGITSPVIVSLTSFPARIKFVSDVVRSIIEQTVKADKILLWLAEVQFPNKGRDLPYELLALESSNDRFEIKWCDDIRSHKKYYCTMREFPDSVVITVDDDVYYEKDLIEKLLNSYVKHPYAVSAMRAHVITFDEKGRIAPYSKWKREYNVVGFPSLALCATGVSGILYPPRSMHEELFDKEQIVDLCLNADDLWLKIMQIMNNTPVVVADEVKKIENIENSQDVALWKLNDTSGENDRQFAKIIERYNTYFSDNDTLVERMKFASRYLQKGTRVHPLGKDDAMFQNKVLKRQLGKLNGEVEDIRTSWSYRIGRFITFIPRKIRGGIRCYQEHGMYYTLHRVKEKFNALFRKK